MAKWMQRSGGRELHLIPINSSASFPRSAVEWKASDSIAGLPVNAAATYLQIAIATTAELITFLERGEGTCFRRGPWAKGCLQTLVPLDFNVVLQPEQLVTCRAA